MEVWFSSLSLLEKILWFIAIPSSIVFFIQLLMSFFGGDHYGDLDFDSDFTGSEGHDLAQAPGFFSHVLTIQNFVVFLTIFSWTGIACLQSGAAVWLTIILALIFGIIAMLTIASLYFFFGRMVETGNLKLTNSIGAVGEVYIPIKAHRKNIGRVQITIQGALREMSAMTDSEDDLPTKTIVKVKEIVNQNILLVEKVA
ncbi:MAG: hypothetical protein SFW35_01440 [Chitinophagales bacterium]|nr:hypothetical protein [Chitinophagales bacterium]